jgi:hypothetical protein
MTPTPPTATLPTTMITEYSPPYTTGIFRDHGIRAAGGAPAALTAPAGWASAAPVARPVPVARTVARTVPAGGEVRGA